MVTGAHRFLQDHGGATMKKHILGVAIVGLVIASVSWTARAATTEQELTALEHIWKQAVVAGDAATLQRLYADEFTSIDQEGAVWNKAEDIGIDTNGWFRLDSYRLEDMNVRVYGDLAVVTGRNTMKGTFLGRAVMSQVRFTDVFVKRDGRWQCVTTQATPIVKE
jgi:ketosteroid isomerase-like protein